MRHVQLCRLSVFAVFLHGLFQWPSFADNPSESANTSGFTEEAQFVYCPNKPSREGWGDIEKLHEVKRRVALSLIAEKALSAKSLPERQHLTEYLALGLFDDSIMVHDVSKKKLLDFVSNDLSQEGRQTVQAFLKTAPLTRENILLAGNVDDPALMSKYRELARNGINEPGAGRWYGTAEWAALLVLGRKGEFGTISRIVRKVEDEEDLVIRITRLLDDVAYTRSSEGAELLIKYLESDIKLPRVKSGVSGELVCKRAAFLLGKIIEGFPVQKKYYADYTWLDIETCRKWIKQNRNSIKIND